MVCDLWVCTHLCRVDTKPKEKLVLLGLFFIFFPLLISYSSNFYTVCYLKKARFVNFFYKLLYSGNHLCVWSQTQYSDSGCLMKGHLIKITIPVQCKLVTTATEPLTKKMTFRVVHHPMPHCMYMHTVQTVLTQNHSDRYLLWIWSRLISHHGRGDVFLQCFPRLPITMSLTGETGIVTHSQAIGFSSGTGPLPETAARVVLLHIILLLGPSKLGLCRGCEVAWRGKVTILAAVGILRAALCPWWPKHRLQMFLAN